jgi:hypothetical protein
MASIRNLAGENRGSVGLDASLFFTETFRFTGQVIRSHGSEEGGNWAFFVRPSRDTSTSHVHFRYTHLGDRLADHVNAIGFIRDDDRREMDSALEKQFWFTHGTFERVAYDSNYNIYWSQEGVLRSWKIDQSVDVDFRNRWSTRWSYTEEYKLFEKEFRNRENQLTVVTARTSLPWDTTPASGSRSRWNTRLAGTSTPTSGSWAPPSAENLPTPCRSSTSFRAYGWIRTR